MRRIGSFFWFTVAVFASMALGWFILHFLDSHGPSGTRSLATAVENAAHG